MSIDTVVAQLTKDERQGVARLIDWLKIPSISTDPAYAPDCRRAAEWTVKQLKEVGVNAVVRETGTPAKPGHPIVWAEHPGAKGYTGPHVLFYGHYDVQPVDPLNLWENPPFEPVTKPAVPNGPGERIVARGAVDDKGQVSTFLEALRAWKTATGEIPVKFTILIEGEEESGSVNLDSFIRANTAALKACDICVISDTGMLDRKTPAITYGVRGLVYTEVVLHAANQDLHSGLWGGRCPNPITELVKVLAQLWDSKRRVTIPGFYDDVRDLTPAERANWKALNIDPKKSLASIGLPPQADVGEEGYTATEREWGRPTAEINGIYGGYMGKGAKTVISSSAGAKISFRLVADQKPEKICASFKKWIEERTPSGCRWEFHEHSGGPGVTTPVESKFLTAASRALEAAAGKKPALIKSGGSIPVAGLFKALVGLDTIFMGFGLEDDRVHSPNEKFELACWRLGAGAHARLIDEFARMT